MRKKTPKSSVMCCILFLTEASSRKPDHIVHITNVFASRNFIPMCEQNTHIWIPGKLKRVGLKVLLKIISFLFLRPEMSPGIKSVVSRNETEIMHWVIKMTPAVVTWSESMTFVNSKLAGNMQEEQVESGKH